MGSISQILHDKFNDLTDYELIGGRDSAFAMNKVDGVTTVHKFGGGIVQTTERTVWDNMANADYPYKFTNSNMNIVSDDASDTGQTIKVYYIELVDGDWVYKYGKAVTAGLTPVQLEETDENFVGLGTAANVMFPFRMINVGTGQNAGNAVGNITLTTGATIYAQITNGYNQSLMALFPIATGYSAFVHSIGRSVIGSAKACTFTYASMPFGECRQARIVKGLSDGSEETQFDIPYFFTEKTILSVRAKIDTGTAQVTSSFDLVLIKNENL